MASCCTVSMTLLQVLYVTLMDCAVLSSRLFSGSFLQILWLCLALLALFFSKSSSFCQLFSLCFHIVPFVVAFSSLLSKAWLPCKLNSFVRHRQHFWSWISSVNLLDNPPSFCQLSVFHIIATFCCSFLLCSFQKHGHLAKYYVYSVLNW